MRKFYLIVAPLLLLVMASSFVYSYFANSDTQAIPLVFMPAWGVLLLLSLLTMLKYGTFRKKKWSRLAYLGAGIAIIGFALELQQKIDGKIILITGMGIFVMSYLAYFAGKPKTALDWFKAGYIATIPVVLVFAMWEQPYLREVHTASVTTGLITICQYYVDLAKKKKQVAPELTTDGQQLFQYPEE